MAHISKFPCIILSSLLLLFLLYIKWLNQAVVDDLGLYTDDTWQLLGSCKWFVDHWVCILVNTKKSILLRTKHKDIVCNSTEIKQSAKVKYLQYLLDESFSGESMALNNTDKVNLCLKILQALRTLDS